MSSHTLTWGTTDDDALMLSGYDASGELYWFETLANNATFGNPQPVEVGLRSLLLDGTRKQITRYDNRTPSFLVTVCAPNAYDLAQGEAALWRMAQTVGTVLTWTPPNEYGAPTVFEVETARMEFQFDDLSEREGRQRIERTYQVSWECQPFTRSVDLTVQPAVAVDTSLTIVDDCSSATGWSGEGGITVSSGAVVTVESTGDRFTALQRSGAIDMSTRPYLVIDWKTSVPANFIIYGHQKDEVMRVPSPFGSTWTRSYYYLPAGVPAGGVSFLAAPLPNGATMSVTQLATTTSLPDSDTGGTQQSLTIAPGGSARTQAQFEVVNTGTAALGEVTLYTAPLGSAYMPSMRRWLYSSDTPTPNPTGAFQTIAGPSAYDIPASTIPVGGYMIAARMMCTTTATVKIVYSLQTLINGTVVGDYIEEAPSVNFVAGEWRVIPLGLATLPTSRVGPAGVIRLGIQRETSSSAVVNLHDTFLFHEDGDLTIVDCGSGTSAPGGSSRRLRILPPSGDLPGGGLEMGHSEDWSDAFAAGSRAVHRPERGHVLHPDGTSVFLMTPNTPAGSPAAVTASWYKRHHTHAVD